MSDEQKDNPLELVPTRELIDELMSRHDCACVLFRKDDVPGAPPGSKSACGAFHKGDIEEVIGFMYIYQHRLASLYFGERAVNLKTPNPGEYYDGQ